MCSSDLEFYHKVFELELVKNPSGKPGFYLSDGHVTLLILPWSIDLFAGMAIKRPGPDHIGFKVENMDAFKQHLRDVAGANYYLSAMPLGGAKEADVRKNFLAQTCAGKLQIADPGAVWIDITDE